ncbi:MAG: hypothetical protein KA586_02060 [Candidatus Promineofilum sp.]|nr:hypothetical protein [Promineifilum sp.]
MTRHDLKPPTESTHSSPLLGLLGLAFMLAIAGCAALSSATPGRPASASRAEELITSATTPQAASGEPSAYIVPVLGSSLEPTPGPTSPPTLGAPLPPPTVVVALPPIDFEAARASAHSRGLDIAFSKIGFHTGPGGSASGLGQWMNDLNAAGIPFFLKSTDDAGPILEAQNLMKANEAAGRFVPHTLVFRLTDPRFEAPFYNLSLSPEEAAAVSWQLNRDNVPADLEKEYIWLETLNEPGRSGDNDQLQIERLGRFSLETAKLALADGYRYGAFSWSTGVPEPEDWEHPAMLDFLRFAGEHPDEVAVAIHEYSLTNDFIGAIYPYLVGRFQALFDVCDKHGIPRPTILITEWGWEYNSVPQPIPAVEDMAWASWLYAAYPQVKGAAVWYLGGQFGGIAQKAQQLILPMRDYARSHYFIIDPGSGRIDAELFRPKPPTLLGVEPLTLPTPFPRPRTMP